MQGDLREIPFLGFEYFKKNTPYCLRKLSASQNLMRTEESQDDILRFLA